MINRRVFLQAMSGAAAGLMLPLGTGCRSAARDRFGELLPLRLLGKTGEKVTMLGLGGYHVGWTTEKDAAEVIETAIEGGIRFFDTAHNYGRGTSEERYGKYLVPNYRDEVFLMTKTQAGDEKALLSEVDLSLKRLQTDRVDLLQLHSLKTPSDVDERWNNGVIDATEKILEDGKARYIGFTGHQNPYAHLRMLERLGDNHPFSTIQLPLNPVDFASSHSHTRQVLPVAVDQGLGILAMKTLADGRFFRQKEMPSRVLWQTGTPLIPDTFSISEALYFSWSLPISVLITGAENAPLLEEKLTFAKEFVKQSEDERSRLLDRIAGAPELEEVEYYKIVKPETIL